MEVKWGDNALGATGGGTLARWLPRLGKLRELSLPDAEPGSATAQARPEQQRARRALAPPRRARVCVGRERRGS
jgi:hypothetical protein